MSGSTLVRAGAPAAGGTGGNGGNGGGAGIGGTDTSDTACQLLCGTVNIGLPGGSGPSRRQRQRRQLRDDVLQVRRDHLHPLTGTVPAEV